MWWLYVYMLLCFCKQKTAYEMRISDWSSDVCSSDLRGGWRGASGVQYSHRDFNAVGAEAFVPRNLTDQFALFTLQEYTAGPLGLEAAARYEKTNVRAQTLGFERNFDSFSGALGATYDIFEGAKFGVSVSRAVRAPSARSEEHTSELQSLMRT